MHTIKIIKKECDKKDIFNTKKLKQKEIFGMEQQNCQYQKTIVKFAKTKYLLKIQIFKINFLCDYKIRNLR